MFIVNYEYQHINVIGKTHKLHVLSRMRRRLAGISDSARAAVQNLSSDSVRARESYQLALGVAEMETSEAEESKILSTVSVHQ